MKRTAIAVLSAVLLAASTLFTACSGSAPAQKTEATAVPAEATAAPAAAPAALPAGTYSVTYGTQEISGNVRHTGYLSALGAQEKNTLELKEDGTYIYTKLVTSDPDILAGTKPVPENVITAAAEAAEAAPAAAPGAAAVLFSWAPNNEGEDKGTCTLDFYTDGTYVFGFPAYNVEEQGTWSWEHFTMKVTKPSGTVLDVAMKDDTHALYFDYVSDMNEMLHQNFIAETSAWGVALGASGTYEPVAAAGEAAETPVEAYFTGKGVRKTAEGNDYEVTLHLFLLKDGNAYIAEANDNNTVVTVGSWTGEQGAYTVTDGTDSAEAKDTLAWKEIEAAVCEAVPEEYVSADWAALIKEANAPKFEGPVVIFYTFSGTYTADGTTVTLNPAEQVEWSEDWGSLQNHGFTNVKGIDGSVFNKGTTGSFYLALDHFAGPYYIAPGFENTEKDTVQVTNNLPVKVALDGSGSFDYIVESVFD